MAYSELLIGPWTLGTSAGLLVDNGKGPVGSRMVYASSTSINTKNILFVANSILHSLERFEDERMNARHGILPRVKKLQTPGKSYQVCLRDRSETLKPAQTLNGSKRHYSLIW